MGGNVELSADLGTGEFLLSNKLDRFSLKLSGKGAMGNSFHGYP